jgi:hypothetical protein
MIDDRVQSNEINLYNDVEYDLINHENENDENLYKLVDHHDRRRLHNVWLEEAK